MTAWLRRWFARQRPNIPEAWSTYVDRARAAGVDRLYLLLTFDCDTDLDITAAPELMRELQARRIKAGFAVPGPQLRKSPATWRAIAAQGAEFLNHGERPHTEFRDGRYWPITFYDQLAPAEVIADIEAGDRTVRELTGVTPLGFRAPHFGSYQAPEQLAIVHRTARALGYCYCSTTTPALALTRGPVVDMNGIVELPTLGSYRHPTTLLDSWTYLTDRVNYQLGDMYAELFLETLDRMTRDRIPGILTYYADPAHVTGMKPFADVLDAIARSGIPSLHGRDVVERFAAV